MPVGHSDDLKLCSDGQQHDRLSNSVVLNDLDAYLSYLADDPKKDGKNLIWSYLTLFGDIPSRTTILAKCEFGKAIVTYLG